MNPIGKNIAHLGQLDDLPRSQSTSAQDQASWRLHRVQMLLACYRKDEAINPEMYAAALGAVLSMYSREIVEFVTDPRTGIASTCKWLPAVAEVKEACERILADKSASLRREQQTREQIVERKAIESARARTPDEQARVDYQVDQWHRRKALKADDARAKTINDSNLLILREYKALGLAPRYSSDGTIISPQLAGDLEQRAAS